MIATMLASFVNFIFGFVVGYLLAIKKVWIVDTRSDDK